MGTGVGVGGVCQLFRGSSNPRQKWRIIWLLTGGNSQAERHVVIRTCEFESEEEDAHSKSKETDGKIVSECQQSG